jgi:hypothetical protein
LCARHDDNDNDRSADNDDNGRPDDDNNGRPDDDYNRSPDSRADGRAGDQRGRQQRNDD